MADYVEKLLMGVVIVFGLLFIVGACWFVYEALFITLPTSAEFIEQLDSFCLENGFDETRGMFCIKSIDGHFLKKEFHCRYELSRVVFNTNVKVEECKFLVSENG